MRAALGARDRVHLVEDHRLHARERVARGRGQHQEQRLGGGDQDVRRTRGQGAPLGRRGVAGADTDPDLGLGQAQTHGLLPNAGERAAQVPLDVDREGLQRGHVEDPAALLRIGRGRGEGQLVQSGEERGQGLARAGRGHHQHIRTRADGLPRAGLGRGGRGERPREPAAGRGGEAVEGSACGADHASILHPTTDNRADLGKCHGARRGAGRARAVARTMGVWRVVLGAATDEPVRRRVGTGRWSVRGTGGTTTCRAWTCCGPGTSARPSSATPTSTSSSRP